MTSSFVRALFRAGWPTPSIDRLLRAAMHPDEAVAVAAWRDFEASVDFDHLTNGEMRLIGLAAKRLERLAPDSPMRARIGGIERANWSRSQLAIAAGGSALRALGEASIELLLIKGAARSALGGPSARGRIVNDVDVVVRPEDMARAFAVLADDGWQPAGSGSAAYHRAHLASATGINLVKGRFGNLDLHRTPFHPPYLSVADDAAVWQRAGRLSVAGVAVRVPAPTDFAVIAIAHGSHDAHKSSDWLADVADCLDRGIDWALLDAEIGRRGLEGPAAVALGYVAARLERPVPEPLLDRLQRSALRHPVRLLGTLSEIGPKARRAGFFWLTRAVAKQSRLLRRHGGDAAERSRIVFPSPLSATGPSAAGRPKVFEAVLGLPGRRGSEPWTGTIDLSLAVDLPARARRVDFEINSNARHCLRLRALVLGRGRREKLLRFRFALSLDSPDEILTLLATPSRRFNEGAPPDLTERYGALPFAVVRVKAERSGPGR